MPRVCTIKDVLARIHYTLYCWEWRGSVSSSGYGVIGSRSRRKYAHRLLWEAYRGPIPPGLELDHLCRNPLCVNPAHLEPVTHHENLLRGESPAAQNARKVFCNRGHFDWYIRPDGKGRLCRTCLRERRRDRNTTATKEAP